MSNARAVRSLQRKVSVRLALAMAAFIAGVFAIMRGVITPAFEELELTGAHADLVRAEQSIQAEMLNLQRVSLDWSSWDDMYEYAVERNPEFVSSNLDRSTLINLGLDMLAIHPADGEPAWQELMVGGEQQPFESLQLLRPENPVAEILTQHASPETGRVGIVDTGYGPMIVSSQPILRNDDSGPVAGALIMAQFLDDARLDSLRERTEVDMGWQLVEDFTPSGDLGIGELPVQISDEFVTNCLVMADMLGNPYLLLSSNTPRDVTWLGQQAVGAAVIFLAAAGVLLMIVLWWFMKGTIIKPIEELTAHMDKVRKSGDLTDKLDFHSDDEIGLLAARYDALNSEVHETRAALLHQSFKAGKADTAAEVLHNIRNAMTPLINGLDRIGKAFRVTEGLHVKKAVDELLSPERDPRKTDKFGEYIEASFGRIATVHDEAIEDLNVVTAQAKQVEGILADQEKFTSVVPIAENLVIDEVIEEAVHVIPKESDTEVEVDVDESLAKFRVCAHRVGLLQVLGNLMLNAHESIQRAGRGSGTIALSASETVFDDADMVQLTVSDNGTGFEEDVRNKIFQRGFTSKAQGETTGLGLHWCANAVASMGGRIFADSQGEGHGAEFHVLLPAAQGG